VPCRSRPRSARPISGAGDLWRWGPAMSGLSAESPQRRRSAGGLGRVSSRRGGTWRGSLRRRRRAGTSAP
jgi:hypothetical protein